MREMPRIPPEEARARARAAELLAADPRVKLIFLFGSAADPDRTIPVRDVDLAILTDSDLGLLERPGCRSGPSKPPGERSIWSL